ncbi:MAG: hypothetical protein Tsb0034_07780 [Ekhidna sp.]
MRYLFGTLLITISFSLLAQEGGLKRPDIPGDVMVDVGLNFWDTSSDSLDQKAWSSKSISIYYMKNKVLSNKFTFNYGVGLGLEKISLGNRNTLVSLEDSVLVADIPLDLTQVDIRKNKLATTYLDVPFELRFYPMGTEEGEGLFVSVGGVAGIRMNAHRKIKWEDINEVQKQKNTGRFDLNSFRYGVQARIGFKGVHLFYKQYFSNTFRNDVIVDGAAQDFNPRMTTIGINVTGF